LAADGTVDGTIDSKYWIVQTFDELYGQDDRVALPSAERGRIQVIHVCTPLYGQPPVLVATL